MNSSDALGQRNSEMSSSEQTLGVHNSMVQ
jgi:hypothetical protein